MKKLTVISGTLAVCVLLALLNQFATNSNKVHKVEESAASTPAGIRAADVDGRVGDQVADARVEPVAEAASEPAVESATIELSANNFESFVSRCFLCNSCPMAN